MQGWFPWPVFMAGMGLASWAALASLKLGSVNVVRAPDTDAASALVDRSVTR
jgi:hypothetical protein